MIGLTCFRLFLFLIMGNDQSTGTVASTSVTPKSKKQEREIAVFYNKIHHIV